MNNISHFVGRTADQKNYELDLDVLWKESLKSISTFKVHAFVLMPNHFHLLAHTTDSIDNLKSLFRTEVCEFKISSFYVYKETYRYIILNPVRAGLCKLPHLYPYSTFSNSSLPFLIHSKFTLGFGGVEGELNFILS